MLENENKMIKEIDKLILGKLKEKLEIKKGKNSILSDEEVEKVLRKIDKKKAMIFLLFQGDFSINERNIEQEMRAMKKTDMNFYDIIANNVILKRLEATINEIESLRPRDGRLISVCYDRKFFIQRVLQENLSLDFVARHIENEEIEI